jgi:hypothetical protein
MRKIILILATVFGLAAPTQTQRIGKWRFQ